MGLVAFTNMPSDIRVPLFYAEVNAGIPPYSGLSRTVLMGRKLSAGSATIGVPINLGSQDPNALFGAGSMLTDMVAYARWHNPNGEIWACPLTDPGGAVAATYTITVTGPATASGTVVVYVAGERFQAGVASGDSATVIALALSNAINAGYTKFNRSMLLPVTSSPSAGVITLTARHAGTEGNSIRVEQGLVGDEVTPAGVTVVIANGVSGTGAVDMTAGLAFLGQIAFDWIVAPYSTTTQLDAAKVFLSDAGSGRWSPTVGLYGHYITSADGTLSALTAIGAARNDRHCTILGTQGYPQTPWCWIGALGGVIGFHKNLGAPLSQAIEIARPLQTLPLAGLRPPKLATSQWGLADRDSLYHNGISAVTFGADGGAVIDRIVTNYLTNTWGVADVTFLDIETVAIAEYACRYLKSVITSTYPRHVLRDDNPRGLQGVCTPDQIKATVIHAYNDLCFIGGLAEKPDIFAQFVIVERSTDPNRVNLYFPLDESNQLRVFAANITVFAELNAQIASLQ